MLFSKKIRTFLLVCVLYVRKIGSQSKHFDISLQAQSEWLDSIANGTKLPARTICSRIVLFVTGILLKNSFMQIHRSLQLIVHSIDHLIVLDFSALN